MPLGDILDSIRGVTPQQSGGQKGGSKRQARGFGVLNTNLQVQAEETHEAFGTPAPVPLRPGTNVAAFAQQQMQARAGTSPQAGLRAAQFSGIDPSSPQPSGSILDAANASPANLVIGLQNLIPAIRGEGFEEFKRLRAEGLDIGNAIGQAYEAQDFPKFVKGGLEVFAQPDVLVPGAMVAGRFGRGIGAAFKAGAKSQLEGDLATLGGKFAAREMPTVKKFVGLVDTLKPARAATETLKSEELSKRASRIDTILKDDSNIRSALKSARAARAGTLPRAEYESLLGKLSDSEVDELLTIARDSPDLRAFDRVRAMSLLDPADPNSLINGKLPTLGEIKMLGDVFGDELASKLLDKAVGKPGALEKAVSGALNVLNYPRTSFSSLDVSAAGRQAAPIFAAHPQVAKRAFAAQLRAMSSEKDAIIIQRGIWKHPDSGLLQRSGTFIADVSGPKLGRRVVLNAKKGSEEVVSALSQQEEAYMSNLPEVLEKVPGKGGVPFRVLGRGIRASERAYVTYLNKVRSEIFYDTIAQWRKAEKPITDEALRSLGSTINNLTGRGNLPGLLEQSRPLLSAVFFSPGLQASRINLVASLFDPRMDPAVRRELYKDVAAGVALGTMVTISAKAAGADVETDPRSTDFGRVKVGPTRLDFWGGFQPYARLASQLWSEEIKTSRGEIASLPNDFGTSRGDQLMRFGRTKLSPGAGIIVNSLVGETFLGEEPVSVEQSFNTLVPGAIQDVVEAIREQGVAKGIPLGLPAFLGITVNSYSTTNDLYNAVASRLPDENGDIGRSFTQLEQWEKELVRQDPKVLERITEIEEKAKAVPLRELRSVVFEQNARFRQDVESELLTRVGRGLKGRELLEAIQGFQRDRYVASQAVFEPFRDRLFKAPSVHKDVLAQEYWTAPLDIGEDGSLDFETREALRADVLRRAKESGVDTTYITETGKGTWRGALSDNPKLNDLLTQYETDMKTLKGYWEAGSDPNFAGAVYRDLWARYLNGSSAERREIARTNTAIQRAVRRQSEQREVLREQNADIDRALVRWYEYLGKTPQGRGLYQSLYVME